MDAPVVPRLFRESPVCGRALGLTVQSVDRSEPPLITEDSAGRNDTCLHDAFARGADRVDFVAQGSVCHGPPPAVAGRGRRGRVGLSSSDEKGTGRTQASEVGHDSRVVDIGRHPVSHDGARSLPQRRRSLDPRRAWAGLFCVVAGGGAAVRHGLGCVVPVLNAWVGQWPGSTGHRSIAPPQTSHITARACPSRPTRSAPHPATPPCGSALPQKRHRHDPTNGQTA